jgi:uncharacterized membrane protein
MKTWKQRTVIGIFAIISIIFAFITCDNGDEENHTHQWQWVVTGNATVPDTIR